MLQRLLLSLVVAVCLAPAIVSQSRFDLHEVAWTVSPDPSGDFFRMSMELDPLRDRERLLVRMPWWRPGSYRYARYHEKVREFRAVDQADRVRAFTKLDPRTWEVDTRGVTSLRVEYELEVSNINEAEVMPAIHCHGPATFLYVEDALELSHRVRFDLPEGWDVASGHRPDPNRPGWFRSPNYDVFVDCPLAIGDLERHAFESHGIPFEIVLFGRKPTEEQFSRADWVRKVKAMVEASHALMGGFPFEYYVFLFFFENRGGGYGLEHLNSTSIAFNHRIIKSGQITGLESVTAHEFVHLWNVKRIRPAQLGPFDYATDVRSRDLWWLEGVTSYYQDVVLQRAGLRQQANWFWDEQARIFNGMRRSNGFGVLSPERSSWTVWDPGSGPRISYYDQGQVLGLLLDLKIRVETENRRSLDDVMRFLHRWVDYPNDGYQPGDLPRAIHAVTGWDCGAFFDRYVAGLNYPPYQDILPAAGLEVVDGRPGEPKLGLNVDSEMRLVLSAESVGTQLGLRTGDRLLEVSGQPTPDRNALRRAVRSLEVGTTVPVKVERDGATMSYEIEVQERTRSIFRIRPATDATPLQRAIREGVLTGTPEPV